MKIALLVVPAIAALCVLVLAGCSSTGTLTPQAQAVVTSAYNDVCPAIPGLATLPMNANQATAYKAAVAICANGVPSNGAAAAADLVALDAALQPLLAKIHVSVK